MARAKQKPQPKTGEPKCAESAPASMGRWSLEEVERLAALMKRDGISLVEVHGLKLIRSPQQSFYEDLAKKSAQIEKTADKVTDEDILMNPMAGLEGLNNG